MYSTVLPTLSVKLIKPHLSIEAIRDTTGVGHDSVPSRHQLVPRFGEMSMRVVGTFFKCTLDVITVPVDRHVMLA